MARRLGPIVEPGEVGLCWNRAWLRASELKFNAESWALFVSALGRDQRTTLYHA